MRRYLIWAAVVYLLLLLFPLPLLGKPEPKTQKKPQKEFSALPGADKDGDSKGVFRLQNADTGEVYEVPELDFVIGAVSAEMYPTYHTEALKAQAVASYTYYSAIRKRSRANPAKELKGADFSDKQLGFNVFYTKEQLKERWKDGFEVYYKKVSDAVESVFGKLITYDDQPITAVYHAISAGTTEDAAVLWGTSYPYLQPVPSPGDKLSPDYLTEASFTPDELDEKLSRAEGFKASGEPDKWIKDKPQTSASGTVTQIEICGRVFTGVEIRELLGLRSACFSVRYGDGEFVFTVSGYGHNVGMSQYGADYLARQGMTYEEILRYYYTDVQIK